MNKLTLRSAKYLGALVLVGCSVALATPASADSEIRGYPSHWRLQDYETGEIVLWFTGTPCGDYGQAIMNVNTPAETRARFWSLLLTAVATNRQVAFQYDSTCRITNFYNIEGQ